MKLIVVCRNFANEPKKNKETCLERDDINKVGKRGQNRERQPKISFGKATKSYLSHVFFFRGTIGHRTYVEHCARQRTCLHFLTYAGADKLSTEG
jgi:hypothetical protein